MASSSKTTLGGSQSRTDPCVRCQCAVGLHGDTNINLSQELFHGLRRRINLAIDQHAAAVPAPRRKLPRYIVPLTCEFCPFRTFGGVLL